METVERLAAIEAIKRVKAQYFRGVDTKDWSSFAATFAPDASLEVSVSTDGETQVVRGRDEITTFVRSHAGDLITVHHGHTPEIDVLTATSATGIWALEDVVWWNAEATAPGMRGFGHYFETYAKIDDEWYIQSSKLTRIRVDFQS